MSGSDRSRIMQPKRSFCSAARAPLALATRRAPAAVSASELAHERVARCGVVLDDQDASSVLVRCRGASASTTRTRSLRRRRLGQVADRAHRQRTLAAIARGDEVHGDVGGGGVAPQPLHHLASRPCPAALTSRMMPLRPALARPSSSAALAVGRAIDMAALAAWITSHEGLGEQRVVLDDQQVGLARGLGARGGALAACWRTGAARDLCGLRGRLRRAGSR